MKEYRRKLLVYVYFFWPIPVLVLAGQQFWLSRKIVNECTVKYSSPFEQKACIEVQNKLRWFS